HHHNMHSFPTRRSSDLLIKMVGDEYEKARPGTVVKSAHVGMSASNTYVFMSEVLPRAIKKYGGVDADALRKAALEVDIPEGGTIDRKSTRLNSSHEWIS